MVGFKEVSIITEETNIELFKTLDAFKTRMEEHMEKFPNYAYSIELLGGNKGSYSAEITIIKYDKKTELA
jgi:hypothetical protein